MDGPRNFPLGITPFTFADLYDPAGLARLDATFLQFLTARDPAAADALRAWREGRAPLSPADESALLLQVASPLGAFVAKLFAVEGASDAAAADVARHGVVYAFKNQFVDKRVRRRRPTGDEAPLDQAVHARLREAWAGHLGADPAAPGGPGAPADAAAAAEELAEAREAHVAMNLLALWQIADSRPAAAPEALAEAAQQLSGALGEAVAPEALRTRLAALLAQLEAWHRPRLADVPWVSYRQPKPICQTHKAHLTLERTDAELPEAIDGPADRRRRRLGFDLTDGRASAREALAEVDYCLICHPRGRDSCRVGLQEKDGTVKHTPLGAPLTGCPLDQRISEAHRLIAQGEQIAALAMVMRDNPMCPGTGHRICNDCMKSCIFQKQTPVNVPQVETHLVTRVLGMPYGFEIYALLTRFNPLRAHRPYPVAYTGHNALVVGLGPAGYTLAHWLLLEGFGVVGIDGLKLEPLEDALVGRDSWPPEPVKDVAALQQTLGARVAQGFGGVAEYGITVRWDKNFLRVIYLNLLRWQTFAAFGGVRLGSTLSLDDAWKLGFDHVALAAGAGRPTVVELENNLMRGMRAASDFLMGLQLTGAFRADSLANLQVELPAVVIGGGLTAVDTATELAAYYPVQVRKLAARVEALGYDAVCQSLDDEERGVLDRMLRHAAELAAAEATGQADVPALVRRWGGVKVAYRRGLTDSPAYRLNHEEVEKALQEGITFVEHVTPVAAVPDAYNHVDGLRVRRRDGSTQVLPARSVIMAAGTTPNTIYAREFPGAMALDAKGRFFQANVARQAPGGGWSLAPAAAAADAFFTSYLRPPQLGEGARALPPRLVSFFGDNHPAYAGNVVRAMASAKVGHRAIVALFAEARAQAAAEDPARQSARKGAFESLVGTLRRAWEAKVVAVNRLTPTIVEVVVHAPAQARAFRPGQFFRLQNFEHDAPVIGGVAMSMEGLALTGAWVDADRGLLAMVALEMGVSSRLCAKLRPGQPVVVMGPTGAPTEIPEGETVLLAGGGLGNAVLFSVARALRARGNRVLYFAAYRKAEDMYKQSEVEAASDQVVWSVDQGPLPEPRRPQDRSFAGNVVQAMQAHAEGALGQGPIALGEVDRIICIGSDRMMAAVAHARRAQLAAYLKPEHEAIASINSPMQCMMKEICAQCLQRHVDPVTGKESFVFSCFNQDQRQDVMDWQNLAGRLRQNTLMEKVSGLFLEHLVARGETSATPAA